MLQGRGLEGWGLGFAELISVNTFISATDPPLFLGVDTCRDPGEGRF